MKAENEKQDVDTRQFIEMAQTLKHVAASIDEIKGDLKAIRVDYVTRKDLDYEIKAVKTELDIMRAQIEPVKALVYKGVGVVLSIVLVAVIGLVLIDKQ